MSRVYFTAREREAELRGAERAWCDALSRSIATGLISDYVRGSDYLPLLPEGHYLRDSAVTRGGHFGRDLRMSMGGLAGDLDFVHDGVRYNAWSMLLNTAVLLGGDTIEWATRLHATCELHGYVEGPHRAWLADIIDRGLTDRVLRSELQGHPMGWEDVIHLLRERDDGPVVMSYSVCDIFPEPWEMGFVGNEEDDDAGYEEWEALSDDEAWEKSIAWLRDQNEHSERDLHPDMWGTRLFSHDKTVLDLQRWAQGTPAA